MQYIYPCKPNRLEKGSSLFQTLNDDVRWVAEVKRNGWRCLAMKDETGKLTLWTRHKTLIQDALLEVRAMLQAQLPCSTIIDGELLEKRTIHVKGEYYAFDLIMLKGVSTMQLPLSERRRLLLEVVRPDNEHLSIPTWFTADKLALYERSIASEDCEGIVIKKLDSRYQGSLRSCQQHPFWLKVKRQEAHVKVGGLRLVTTIVSDFCLGAALDAAVEQPRSRKPVTLIKEDKPCSKSFQVIVKEWGGIDPKKWKAAGYDIQDLPIGMRKKGGKGPDELTELFGRVVPLQPDGMGGAEYIRELIRRFKAKEAVTLEQLEQEDFVKEA